MSKTKLLFAGHDLKFLTHVIDHYRENHGYETEVFTYAGHEISDTSGIRRILPEIDIIFCEWGLGNLKWFSQNKLPGQQLVVRIHSQEFFRHFLHETDWDHVADIIFVSDHMRNKFLEEYPGNREKCHVIPNLVDCSRFQTTKLVGASHSLGLLGALPMLKGPRRALEILSVLHEQDPKYKLFIKSKSPQELPWLWQKEEEQAYYKEFTEEVARLKLEDAVFWEPHSAEVAEWFKKIGFILSCSDREAFHLSVAEGMAAGSIPVIRNWDGANQIFPGEYVYKNPGHAAEMIRKWGAQNAFNAESSKVRKFCIDHYDIPRIIPAYDKLLVPKFKMEEIRRDFVQLSESLNELQLQLDSKEKEREQAGRHLESVISQQQQILQINSNYTSELAKLRQELSNLREELSRAREINQQTTANYAKLQGEYQAIREMSNGKIQELTQITSALQDQKLKNEEQKQQIFNLEIEIGRLKEEIRAGMAILEAAKAQHKEIDDALIREKVQAETILTQEIERLNKELNISRSTIAATQLKLEQERFQYLARIDHLKTINLDLERRLIETFSSMSWKLGALLIKKPVELLIKIRTKLLPAKKSV